jgi:predicted DsbA family dithiol-disulfide isomerase
MHDSLFANQKALGVSDMQNYAKGLELDQAKFQACMGEEAATATVRADLAEAQRLGLTATPAFLIGEAIGSGRVKVTRRIDGAHPIAVFESAIAALLATARPAPQ